MFLCFFVFLFLCFTLILLFIFQSLNFIAVHITGRRGILPPIKDFVKYLALRNELTTAETVFFITSKGGKLYSSLVYRIINSYFSKVSTKAKKSPHVLRHSYATDLINNGADLNSVKELLGHSSLAATQVYTHNSLDKLKKVYNQAHPRSATKTKNI